jgi:hypothetical protein
MRSVTILDQCKYDSGRFCFGDRFAPGSLNRVIESLLEIRSSIPEQYQETGSCEIGSSDDETWIHVSYQREETDAEVEERRVREIAGAERAEMAERAEFERLKAKFGG